MAERCREQSAWRTTSSSEVGHWGATRLPALMAEAARATGATAFTLRVYRDNDPALAIYERLGFAVVPDLSDARVFAMRKEGRALG